MHNGFRAANAACIRIASICPIVFNVIEAMKSELDRPGGEEPDWPDW
jgi:hypothetical protein